MQIEQFLNKIIKLVGKQTDFADIELCLSLKLHRETPEEKEQTFAVGFGSPQADEYDEDEDVE